VELIRIQTAIGELDTASDNLGAYLFAVRSFIEDASNIPPSALEIPFAANAESIAAANATTLFTANLIGGYLVDLSHNLNSINKEISIRNKNKAEIYAEALIDIDNEITYLDTSRTETEAGIKGNINDY